MENEIELILGTKTGKFKNLIYVKNEDLEIPHGQNYTYAIELLKKIENSILESKSIPELFLYDKISFWWIIYQSLIPEVKQISNFIHEFKKIIKNENVTEVSIKTNFDKLEIIKQICKEQKIKLNYSNSNYLKFKLKQKTKKLIQKNRYAKIFEKKINHRNNLFDQKYSNLPSIENKIVFVVSTNFHRTIFDFSSNQSSLGDYLVTPITNLLEDKIVSYIDLDYTFFGDHEILSSRLSSNYPWFPIEKILEYDISNSSKTFIDQYQKIIKNPDFQNLFVFENVQIWTILKDFFEKMTYSPYLPFYLKLYHSMKEYFSHNKPKSMIIPYETGSLALIIIGVLKSLQVKTIGLQHGYIYPKSPMYSQTNFYSKENPSGFIFPDNLLVFGNYVKNLLRDIGYPDEKIITFGNPALFKLQNFTKNFSEDILRKKFKIKPHQKIILFTTGKMQRNYTTAGIYNYDEKIWENLLTNFKNSDEYYIILKPHPTETNISIYETIKDQIKNLNSQIIQHELFELIQLSSVLVSVVSSSMFEALSLQKPVVQVKFKNKPHPILDNENVVLISNLSNLSNSIESLINSKTQQNEFKQNSIEFIKYHYGIPEENPESILKNLLQ